MIVVNLTAFQLYYLFGHFGIVHAGAIVSLLTLAGGISVVIDRLANWQVWHYRLMSAPVTGLYAAGLVESTYRLFPAAYFWPVCPSVSGFVLGVGAYLIGQFAVRTDLRLLVGSVTEYQNTVSGADNVIK